MHPCDNKNTAWILLEELIYNTFISKIQFSDIEIQIFTELVQAEISNVDNKQEDIFFTKKGNDLYVICTKFPEKSVTINGIRNKGNVKMLGVEGNVKAKQSGEKFTISIPSISPLINPSEFAWVFKI